MFLFLEVQNKSNQTKIISESKQKQITFVLIDGNKIITTFGLFLFWKSPFPCPFFLFA
jgi:hypothetical protein